MQKVVPDKKFLELAIKHDGQPAAIAKEAGLSRQSVDQRIRNNPHIKAKVLTVREEALKAAKVSRIKVYRKLAQGLDAKIINTVDGLSIKTNIPDQKEIRETSKIFLQLMGDLKEDDKEGAVSNVGMLIFNIVSNPNRKIIDVL